MAALAFAVHTLGAVVWVGGMFAIYVCLRPALSTLEPPQGPWRAHGFRDIGRMIAHALEILRAKHQVSAEGRRDRVFHHANEKFAR
jgi:uncharacterized membrane protein